MFKKREFYCKESYNKFLETLLVDKDIKEEIISQVEIFSKGKINFDGDNLYGKIIDKEGNDYLEIKYENKYFICNYTKWNSSCIVNMTQIPLKNGNVKIEKKEKIEFVCSGDDNQTSVEEFEKIYDSNNELIYESKLNYDESYNSLNSSIVYKSDSWWSNKFDLEKKWYISNGSIIGYKLSKRYLDYNNSDNSNLEEYYSICKGSYKDEFNGMTVYNFVTLDEELFKLFMSDKITIDELLEQNSQTEKNKEKVK